MGGMTVAEFIGGVMDKEAKEELRELWCTAKERHSDGDNFDLAQVRELILQIAEHFGIAITLN